MEQEQEQEPAYRAGDVPSTAATASPPRALSLLLTLSSYSAIQRTLSLPLSLSLSPSFFLAFSLAM